MSKRIIQPEMEEEFIKRWSANESTSSMADYYKCHPATILKIAKRLNLPDRWDPRRIADDQDIQEIIKLYDEGISVTAISIRTGIWRRAVQRHLAENGRVVQQYERGARGVGSPAWHSGRTQHTGYWIVYLDEDDPMFCMTWGDKSKNHYVPEHRLVMARKIGRPLLRSETVHHINGDRGDNRPENLQLRSGKHGNGVVHECIDCGSNNIKSVPIADPEEI